MAMTLPAPPGIVVGFAVNSGPEGFTERDRAVMNALRPHLAHAYRSVQLTDELSAVRRALHTRGWTGALADGDGVVRAVTDNARTLEDESGVVLREGDRLPDRMQPSFEAGVSAYDPSTPAVLSRSTRLSDEADGVVGWHVPSPVPPHVVLVQSHVDAGRRRLEGAGLSPRQVQVALQLAEGGTNAAIARRLGIAEGTLRKHLERVYRALDVSDRASAIARIRGT
jgi:DNA-binding CsgD family transcriptional regulator